MHIADIDPQPGESYPFLITFSGIDGAGKSTQIEYLSSYLEKQGLRVLRLSFWDHVAVWPGMRSEVGQRSVTFQRTDRIAKDSFTPRNHKHVRNWYLTAARSALYFLDAVRLRHLLASSQIRNSDVVIFDRYIYDQVANIYSRSSALRVYCQVLLKQTPTPDLAFILDASPDAAFARKPEYPLEFVYRNRRNFLRLRALVPRLITIADGGVEEVRSEIQAHVLRARLLKPVSTGGKTEPAAGSSVDRPQSSCRLQNEPTASV